MAKYLLVFMLFLLMACSTQPAHEEEASSSRVVRPDQDKYVWTKLLDSAPWAKSYSFQLFSIRDTLWTFHNDGNWFSTDATGWTKSLLPNAINNHGFLDYVQLGDTLLGLGRFEGNVERFTFSREVYRTTDLRHWDTLPGNTLPERFFYHPFVFRNRIWIIGGEDKARRYSDLWNSADGISWQKQKENLPFGKRSRSQVVQLHNKLFLLDNDVWSAEDGLNWQQETNAILKNETIFGYAALGFDNKIWLLGCNRNGRFSSQVLVSTDGSNWKDIPAPWTPRGGIAATVHNGKIYLTGGKYGGTPDRPEFVYSNDVWVLEKK